MRSRFVTSLGWLTLVVCAAFAVLAGLELAIFAYLRGNPEVAIQIGLALQERLGEFVDVQSIPPMLLRQGASHALLAIMGVPAGVGLIRRKEWARKLTLAMLLVVTLGSAPSLLLEEVPAGIAAGLSPLLSRSLTLGVFLLICLVHGDIARRLMSAPVRAEFSSK